MGTNPNEFDDVSGTTWTKVRSHPDLAIARPASLPGSPYLRPEASARPPPTTARRSPDPLIARLTGSCLPLREARCSNSRVDAYAKPFELAEVCGAGRGSVLRVSPESVRAANVVMSDQKSYCAVGLRARVHVVSWSCCLKGPSR